MIPLSRVLIKMKAGYIIDILKINNLLFIDDLKAFSKNGKQITSLVSAVQAISKDIGMEFIIKKFDMLVLKK